VTVWGIRAVRRAIIQWRINTAAHEAQLCLRDARVAHENYHAQMRLLAVLHGRQREQQRTQGAFAGNGRAPVLPQTPAAGRTTACPSTRCEVPVLLCVPGRRP
jgi:hypothetical protein